MLGKLVHFIGGSTSLEAISINKAYRICDMYTLEGCFDSLEPCWECLLSVLHPDVSIPFDPNYD